MHIFAIAKVLLSVSLWYLHRMDDWKCLVQQLPTSWKTKRPTAYAAATKTWASETNKCGRQQPNREWRTYIPRHGFVLLIRCEWLRSLFLVLRSEFAEGGNLGPFPFSILTILLISKKGSLRFFTIGFKNSRCKLQNLGNWMCVAWAGAAGFSWVPGRKRIQGNRC